VSAPSLPPDYTTEARSAWPLAWARRDRAVWASIRGGRVRAQLGADGLWRASIYYGPRQIDPPRLHTVESASLAGALAGLRAYCQSLTRALTALEGL
jgi:hypothetical protein